MERSQSRFHTSIPCPKKSPCQLTSSTFTVCIFDIHEFQRLRCRYPRERSVPLRERLAREQQSNPSPREAPLSGYINYDSEPSGCNNKLDYLRLCEEKTGS